MYRIFTFLLSFIALLVACSTTPQNIESYKPIILSQPRDLWTTIRGNLRISDASNHLSVQKQIKWLQKHQADFNTLAYRAAPYLYYIQHEVERRDLPSELALLPIIESAYDPFAYSNQGAAGLWQLMPGTAMGFGLKQNWWYDGRRDIYDSTEVALNYLTYLNKYFDGDWLLTLAAYDSGEGTVRNAINTNKKFRQNTDFWHLSLPRETRAYIPRLLAIASIIKNPERYGMKLPTVTDNPYFSKVKLDFQMDLARAASLAGISKREIYKLNPGYNRWATGPKGPYDIVLPINTIEQFNMNLAQLPKQQRVQWQFYRVKPGDSLGKIAKQHHVQLSELKKANQLKDNLIHVQQALIIPYGRSKPSDRKLNRALAKQNRYGPRKITYVTKGRERIARVAEKFGVSAGAIRFWNRLGSDKLAKNQKIYIWKSKHRRTGKHIYLVQKGDTLGKIAQLHKMSLQKLVALNPGIKQHAIRPNDKIKTA